MKIDTCVCAKRTFAELVQQAHAKQWSTGAGGNCHLCIPYLRCAYHTGQTVFSELLPQDTTLDPAFALDIPVIAGNITQQRHAQAARAQAAGPHLPAPSAQRKRKY